MSTSTAAEHQPYTKKVPLAITLLITAVFFLIPTGEVFTSTLRSFFALTICAILCFAFELMDNFAPSLLLPMAYIMFKVAPASVAYSAWLTNTPWVVIATFCLANTANRLGLLTRVTYKVLSLTGGTYKGIIIGLFVTGLIINIPLAGQGILPMLVIAYSMCLSLELKGTPAAAGLMIVACISGASSACIYYNPQLMGFMLSLFGAEHNLSISWFGYLRDNIVFLGYLCVIVFMGYLMFKPKEDFQGSAYFKEKLSELGPMAKPEKKLSVIMIVMVLFLFTSSWHGLALEWGFIMATVVTFFPGVNAGAKEDIYSINMSFVLFLVACMSIGNVANSLGVGGIIANAIFPYVDGASPVVFIGVTWLLATLLNLVMTPFAILATLPVPLVNLAATLGIDPLPIIYTIMQGNEAIFSPTNPPIG